MQLPCGTAWVYYIIVHGLLSNIGGEFETYNYYVYYTYIYMQLHVHNYVCITYISGLYVASSHQSNREGISSSQAATGMLHGWAGLESTGIIIIQHTD